MSDVHGCVRLEKKKTVLLIYLHILPFKMRVSQISVSILI